MSETPKERRKHLRYETDIKVNFQLPHNLRPEVDFQVDHETKQGSVNKYIGFSRNISARGLCFESNKELQPGDVLWIELHLPAGKHVVVYMQGEVRWCQLVAATPETAHVYRTGVEIKVIDGKDIEHTIYFDDDYGVMWSDLLEKVLGGFAKLHKRPLKVV